MHNFKLVYCDTDSLAFCYPDGREISSDEKKQLLKELNSLFPERIQWEDDGTYERVLVLKTKNFILESKGKRTIKGSALKAPLKEPALKRFMNEVIDLLLADKASAIPALYDDYVRQILNLTDIKDWAFKKSISESILMGEQTTAKKVLEALDGQEFAQGDKRYFYFRTDGSLSLIENWFHDHDEDKLLQKLFKTAQIFETVFDVTCVKNYSLKKNKKSLEQLANG